MSTKRLTIRFNLQNKEERQAWEFLHNRDGPSLSKAVIRILNAAQQYENLQALIRQTITEALQGIVVPVEPVSDVGGDEETDASALDFLDSFS